MTILWNVSPPNVQPPGVVKVQGTGAAPYTNLSLRVGLPNGLSSNFMLVTDEAGAFDDSIYLNSGAGLYTFELTNCQTTPAHLTVDATCCPDVQRNCNIRNLSPVQVIVNSSAALRFSGFLPYEVVSLVINPGGFSYSVTANVVGEIVVSHVFGSIENFTIAVSSATCPVQIFGISVQAPATSFVPGPTFTCAESVFLSYRLDKDVYDNPDAGSLTITMCNYNTSAVVVNGVSLATAVPAWLTFTTPPAFGTTYLTGGQCKTLAFNFTTSGVGSDTLKLFGTYDCGGTIYATSMLEIPIAAVTGVPTVQVSAEIWAFSPSSISVGQKSKLQLKIKNTGTSIVHNVTLASGTLPPALGDVIIGFSGITLLPGQSYNYEVEVEGIAPGVYTITLAPSDLTGTVNGTQYNLLPAPVSTSLTVT